MFTIQDIKNPRWANAEHTLLECDVKFAEQGDYLPFGASIEGDQYPHTKEVFDRAAAEEFGPITEYVAPEVVAAQNQPTVEGAQTL